MAAIAKRDASEKKIKDKTSDKPRTPEDAEREQLEAERAIEHLRAQGRHADADSLEVKVKEHKKQLNDYKQVGSLHSRAASNTSLPPLCLLPASSFGSPLTPWPSVCFPPLLQAVSEEEERAKRHDPRNMDFSNPSEEQIADAKKHGIDLMDPLVRQELQRLQNEKEFGGEESGEEDYDDDDEDDSRVEDITDSRAGASSGRQKAKGGADDVPEMYRGGKMHQRVQRMKATNQANERGMGRGGRGGEYADDFDAEQSNMGLKPRTRMIIMGVAFAIGLYRIWAVLGPALTGAQRPAMGVMGAMGGMGAGEDDGGFHELGSQDEL